MGKRNADGVERPRRCRKARPIPDSADNGSLEPLGPVLATHYCAFIGLLDDDDYDDYDDDYDHYDDDCRPPAVRHCGGCGAWPGIHWRAVSVGYI